MIDTLTSLQNMYSLSDRCSEIGDVAVICSSYMVEATTLTSHSLDAAGVSLATPRLRVEG